MPPIRAGRKLLNWASQIENSTLEQARTTASMPFIHPYVALMPDAHLGKGSAVGTVIPTLGAVIPAAVGVDIGCGMIGVRTGFTKDDVDDRIAATGSGLDALRVAVERSIPLSPGNYNPERFLWNFTAPKIAELEKRALDDKVDLEHSPKWRRQLGSLGGGNHFIELSLDETDHVWLFLHSGSRGVGNKIAQHHIQEAQRLCKKLRIDLPNRDLAYLTEGTPEFARYISELHWAQRFAYLNRAEMMDRFGTVFARWMGTDDHREVDRINCFAGETPVITRTGTRPIEALSGGVHELLTADGEWVKAPVKSFGRREVSEIVLGRSGVVKTIRATAGHRWLLRSRRGHQYEATTAELEPGDGLQYSFPNRPDGVYGDTAATERRGWIVVDVRPTGETTEVYCAIVDGTHSFVLADNILTGNCHHNYTQQEHHAGKEVWLTRKGAVDAHEGVKAIIPGSMGTRSYVVAGTGNAVGLCSAPHGAGRRFSRNEARRRFTQRDLRKRMTGIEFRDSAEFIDEIPDAYKDIDTVMEDARDLVTVLHELRQIVNVKGT